MRPKRGTRLVTSKQDATTMQAADVGISIAGSVEQLRRPFFERLIVESALIETGTFFFFQYEELRRRHPAVLFGVPLAWRASPLFAVLCARRVIVFVEVDWLGWRDKQGCGG